MQFFSTRDQSRRVSASQAIAQGLSEEGGLFVPESFPQVDVKALCGLDYPAMAAAVLREYLTDYDPAFLAGAAAATYGDAFGGKAGYLAPVEGDTWALELWHGPTCAFKDYALQLMPKLLVEAKRNLGRTGRLPRHPRGGDRRLLPHRRHQRDPAAADGHPRGGQRGGVRGARQL